MVVFCSAILGCRGNDFKTLPIPYEVYYQTKFKNKFLKIREWSKSPKLKNLKLKWAKSRELTLQTL
ncbi:hypothetical protein EPC74_06060 [Helicobacter pylori]|nr:hypothetical protein EPC72_06780 [Helicobacter pylori]KAA6508350.1 hypothetical protein EPC74_06060 [Helicobacter pylori]